MSGPVGSQQWMYSSGFYPYKIDNSARLVSGDFYSRTPSSSSNADTFTWSAWIKTTLATTSFGVGGGFLFSAGLSGTREFLIYLDATNQRLNVYQWNGGINFQVVTSKQFRDPSAWYHLVVAYDSSQGTASDRIKIYVNGEQQTDFVTANYPAQGLGSRSGTTDVQDIGKNAYNQGLLADFYLAEVNYISGSQLAPTSFGETKADTWVPKKYEGSYGSQDFYLDFATRATDPIDASGQGNNWTDTNVASTDWMLDSPTNNWATLNPISGVSTNPSYSEGNLKFVNPAGTYAWGYSTIPLPKTGKWVFEVLLLESALGVSPWRYNSAGVTTNPQYSSYATGATSTYLINDHGGSGSQVFVEAGVEQGSHSGLTAGTVVQVQVDCDNNEMTFNLNGTQQTQTGSTVDIPSDVTLYPITGEWNNQTVVNFGQDSSFAGNKTAQGNTDANGLGDFYYSPPAGYLALCTANLPDPVAAIDPALDASPQDHFNTKLYTGNGSTNNITGVGFQPDLVWLKNRSVARDHVWVDVLRGTSVSLACNQTSGDSANSGQFASFDSDGFSLNSSSSWWNASSETYAAWNWKASGSGVSNTDGTVTSTVSANTDAGFSIVTYTGDGASTTTIGHGLSKTPEFYIIKNRTDSGTSWLVDSNQLASGHYLLLDGTNGSGYAGLWGSGPTSSVITVTSNSQTNGNTKNFVAYCFHSVEGFSKFGSYTGNGSADGPFIYTGFRPAFVMLKRTDSPVDWLMYDTSRDPYNYVDNTLYPSTSDAENPAGSALLDIVSNGFKLRIAGGTALNTSSGTYLYMAFAEMPFKYANAR